MGTTTRGDDDRWMPHPGDLDDDDEPTAGEWRVVAYVLLALGTMLFIAAWMAAERLAR